MSTKVSIILISVGLLLTACTGRGQKTAPEPVGNEVVSDHGRGPIPSAAAPGLALEGSPAAADQVLNQAKAAITALHMNGSEPGYREFRIETPQLVFTCQYSPPGDNGEEVPLLACKFGEFSNTVTGHALFWHDGTEWQAQLYPQAPSGVAQQRYTYFQGLGENCPVHN